MKEVFKVTYGSHLYGTSTPASDFDYKVVYLPEFRDVLLGRKLQTFKARFDAQGVALTDGNAPMPDGGFETEYVPLQTFCRDFLGGQTYALECAFAHLQQVNPPAPQPFFWVQELVNRFLTCNVSSMAGFAMKQTFDYVHRGVRLDKARRVLAELEELSRFAQDVAGLEWPRLDTELDLVGGGPRKVIHLMMDRADCELGTTVNNNRTMLTLKLNGREYLETTTLSHLYTAVEKLVASYGHRSQAAAEVAVDLKSLSHAVRVYEQALELLTVGKLTFPRVNAPYLLAVKQGKFELEEVKVRLLELEKQVTEAQANSTLLPAKTPELEAKFETWLLELLKLEYGLR